MFTFFRRSTKHQAPSIRISALHLLLAVIFTCILGQVTPALAQSAAPTQPTSVLINPLGKKNIPQLIGRSVSWLGGLAGSLFFLFLLWGGIEWMLAGGDDGKVKKAKERITASVSGIVVILLAYMIVATIISAVPK